MDGQQHPRGSPGQRFAGAGCDLDTDQGRGRRLTDRLHAGRSGEPGRQGAVPGNRHLHSDRQRERRFGPGVFLFTDHTDLPRDWPDPHRQQYKPHRHRRERDISR